MTIFLQKPNSYTPQTINIELHICLYSNLIFYNL
nr:MAG TPA_asm: hypothetical protein [Caudoviricetes sp.]